MPSTLQEKLAEEIVKAVKQKKPRTKKDLMMSVGYSLTTAEGTAKRVLNSQGFKDSLIKNGFSEDSAKAVVSKILHSNKTKDENKLRASDQIFRVFGSYSAEKHQVVQTTCSLSELFELASRNKNKELSKETDKTEEKTEYNQPSQEDDNQSVASP